MLCFITHRFNRYKAANPKQMGQKQHQLPPCHSLSENINQLTPICGSCTLIPKAYRGLPTSSPASWFIKASPCQEGQKSRLKLSVLHRAQHMMNYYDPAPHIPTARRS